MAKFYHITPVRRLQSIVNSGGLRPPVYLSKEEDLDDWLGSAMIDSYRSGRSGRLAILEVNIPSSWVEEEVADVGPEFVVYRTIPVSRIKSDKIPAIDIRDTPKERYYVTKSGREVTPRWRGKKKKQFART